MKTRTKRLLTIVLSLCYFLAIHVALLAYAVGAYFSSLVGGISSAPNILGDILGVILGIILVILTLNPFLWLFIASETIREAISPQVLGILSIIWSMILSLLMPDFIKPLRLRRKRNED